MKTIDTAKRVSLIVAIILTLGGCADSSNPFDVSPGSLSFTGLTSSDVITPTSQTLVATANQGGMYLLIVIPTIVDEAATGNPYFISGNQVGIDIVPVLPSDAGVGNYNDVIEYTGCTDLTNVSTCYSTMVHQVNVPMSYDVTVSFSLTFDDNRPASARISNGYTGYAIKMDDIGKPGAIQKIDVPDEAIPHLLSR